MAGSHEQLHDLVGKDVILDTASPYIYIGRLVEVADWFFRLEDVDVYDSQETHTTKEVYIIEARKFGIKKNRSSVLVRADKVISISALEAVIEY